MSMAQARKHLEVTDDVHDDVIALKLDQAEALVIGRCNSTAWWRVVTAAWTSATVPMGVQAAILLMLGHLYQNRGDDMKLDAALWESVSRCISMNRDPAL